MVLALSLECFLDYGILSLSAFSKKCSDHWKLVRDYLAKIISDVSFFFFIKISKIVRLGNVIDNVVEFLKAFYEALCDIFLKIGGFLISQIITVCLRRGLC